MIIARMIAPIKPFFLNFDYLFSLIWFSVFSGSGSSFCIASFASPHIRLTSFPIGMNANDNSTHSKAAIRKTRKMNTGNATPPYNEMNNFMCCYSKPKWPKPFRRRAAYTAYSLAPWRYALPWCSNPHGRHLRQNLDRPD